jgi:hypothetical protein
LNEYVPFGFLQEFRNDIETHRELMINLDRTGTFLKYFGHKQDTVYIKNLLISIKLRWKKLVRRADEKGRMLNQAFKEDKRVRFILLFSIIGLGYIGSYPRYLHDISCGLGNGFVPDFHQSFSNYINPPNCCFVSASQKASPMSPL